MKYLITILVFLSFVNLAKAEKTNDFILSQTVSCVFPKMLIKEDRILDSMKMEVLKKDDPTYTIFYSMDKGLFFGCVFESKVKFWTPDGYKHAVMEQRCMCNKAGLIRVESIMKDSDYLDKCYMVIELQKVDDHTKVNSYVDIQTKEIGKVWVNFHERLILRRLERTMNEIIE